MLFFKKDNIVTCNISMERFLHVGNTFLEFEIKLKLAFSENKNRLDFRRFFCVLDFGNTQRDQFSIILKNGKIPKALSSKPYIDISHVKSR